MPEEKKKRFDLSLPQVAGSALAAVLAAKLASTLGVYGTILGAGVISVIATCGGPLLQHLFKRTGEQMREVAAPAKQPQRLQGPGEFGEPTVHGTRMRGWKRPALGAAAVFLIAMGGITAYELTSGQDLGGTKGATTFGSAVRGGDRQGEGGKGEESPAPTPRREGGGAGTPTPDGTSGGGGTGTATPDPTGTPTGSPTPTPSGSTEPTDAPTTTPPSTAPPTTAPASPPATAAE
ncbi:hypothetical protein KV205_15435 [Streptomyces sp. SKN60]|uniref:hypothetical protein n=1 Tax=Streptomyces sp. SKN60 TaxID=2855506 RepID=UPI0027D2DD81|nr:hypothetical protein [Streptomyces sp. SKN60]MCX2181917.1 hypothetical protein [Streptomyces sp. SKN60]